MRFIKSYLLPRLLQYVLVIFFGITVVFFIPRLTGQNPVLEVIAQIQAQGGSLDPVAVKDLIGTMKELYGLKGSLFEQYITMWKRTFTLNFGLSFLQFPTPVSELLKIYLPWTIGLMLTSTLLAWFFGNVIGGIAGYFSQRHWSKFLDIIVMVIRPVPSYIFGLVILLLFTYVWKLFPPGGGALGRRAVFDLNFVLIILRRSFLPALTIVLLNGAVWFQQMKLLVQSVKSEDFVQYAKLGGVKERIVIPQYVLRNAMLPQITQLTLALGQIFSNVLIIEMVFSYPGVGLLLYRAVTRGDYNVVMGIAILSILIITTGALLLDFFYPLFDPRIRHK